MNVPVIVRLYSVDRNNPTVWTSAEVQVPPILLQLYLIHIIFRRHFNLYLVRTHTHIDSRGSLKPPKVGSSQQNKENMVSHM